MHTWPPPFRDCTCNLVVEPGLAILRFTIPAANTNNKRQNKLTDRQPKPSCKPCTKQKKKDKERPKTRKNRQKTTKKQQQQHITQKKTQRQKPTSVICHPRPFFATHDAAKPARRQRRRETQTKGGQGKAVTTDCTLRHAPFCR